MPSSPITHLSCPDCGRHVRVDESGCPFCDHPRSAEAWAKAVALAVTLAAAACGTSDTGGPTTETGSLYAGPTTADDGTIDDTGDGSEASSSSDSGGDGDGDAEGGDGDGDGDGDG